MASLREVFEEHFSNFEVKEGSYTGYIDGDENFQSFNIDIRATGCMYTGRSLNKGTKGLWFQKTRQDAHVQIPFIGHLFQISENRLYECHQGKQRNKTLSSGPISQLVIDHPSTKPRRQQIKQSKKIGCPAKMHVTKIIFYPDYTVSNYNIHGSREQTKMVKKLSEDLKGTLPLSATTRYMIRVSQECVHNHPVISSAVSLHEPKRKRRKDEQLEVESSTEQAQSEQYKLHDFLEQFDDNVDQDVQFELEFEVEQSEVQSEQCKLRELLKQLYEESFRVSDVSCLQRTNESLTDFLVNITNSIETSLEAGA